MGDEADLHAVRLFRHRQAKVPGQLADLGLGIVPQGEDQLPQPGLGQPGQQVDLVVGVRPPAEGGGSIGPWADAGIVPCGHEGRPHLLRPAEEGGELYRGVAPGAGQRGAAGQVVGPEGGHHLPLQLPADVPGGKGDAQGLRHALGVLSPPQADVQPVAVDGVTRLQKEAGGHGGVHPAGQAQDHGLSPHGATPWGPRRGPRPGP